MTIPGGWFQLPPQNDSILYLAQEVSYQKRLALPHPRKGLIGEQSIAAIEPISEAQQAFTVITEWRIYVTARWALKSRLRWLLMA